MKFRKKPVVIEAWHWVFKPDQEETPTWLTDALNKWPGEGGIAFWPDGSQNVGDGEWASRPHIVVGTTEGVMRAIPGDWIIRGVKGELYPCKPDIFEAIYEKAEEARP